MIELDPIFLRGRLFAWHSLHQPWGERGDAGVRSLLRVMRCIQLDPLEPIASNADLVAHARVDGLKRGQVYDALLPSHAFEHFAKERCLIDVNRFGSYRAQALKMPWWRTSERHRQVSDALLQAVLAEVRERGPILAKNLSDQGQVTPVDWSGWKSTSKAASMALQVLWRRCQVVVSGRTRAGKLWSVPTPEQLAQPVGNFFEQGIVDRIQAIGMLPRADGPQWSILSPARKTDVVSRIIEQGSAVEVRLPGSRKSWLAHPELLEMDEPSFDDRMRLLGPLDPMIWDRKLVQKVYGFEYLWEVYKPAEKRRWGWYVCPLIHRGKFVGRVQARRQERGTEERGIEVQRLWREPGFDDGAWRTCLQRLEGFAPSIRQTDHM
ncbi:MAG: hypothetical protein ACI9VR_001065 [Cognaticolwellia sp.]|jgi:uncharacterized protein YcaQ